MNPTRLSKPPPISLACLMSLELAARATNLCWRFPMDDTRLGPTTTRTRKPIGLVSSFFASGSNPRVTPSSKRPDDVLMDLRDYRLTPVRWASFGRTSAEVAVTAVLERVGWPRAEVERALLARLAREQPSDDPSVALGGSARGSAPRK
jgi:hypothetical protein